MTNRELLISALKDELDDPGSSESIIAYHIACPHYWNDGISHPCDYAKFPWNTLTVCGPCIMEWLDSEEAER